MTTTDLARIARDVIPPVGATGWRLADGGDAPDGRVIWNLVPIIGGRLDGAAVFRGRAADARALFRLLAGEQPTPRAVQAEPMVVDGGETPESDPGRPPAPATSLAGVVTRLCAGCGIPLSAGARPNRTTCSGRCRIEAARRRGTVSRRRVARDSDVTVSPDQRASDALRPRPEPAAPSRPLGSARSEASPDQSSEARPPPDPAPAAAGDPNRTRRTQAVAHPKVDLTPWAREALRPAILRAIELGAGQLKANLNAGGSSARGPWVVRVWTGERTVEHRGFDLEGICFEALERFALGADTRSARWTAGADGLAHGHVGTPWTLCKLGAVDPRFAYPETARCRACLRALDVRVAA